MAKIANFLSGFLMGTVVAGLIVTLITPSSGNELRGQVKDYMHNVQDEVKKARDTRRDELERQLDQMRKPLA